jgi:hypothetical protein
VGKTTIEKVFFERIEPNLLLENPLQPSMGINSHIFSSQNTDIGVFDLAGQENNIWLSAKGKGVFTETNVIICVFDIRNSLESIIQFLIKIYKLKKELKLEKCKILAFLHKIDLRGDSYVLHKLKSIKDFIRIQHPRGKDFEIYKTSVTGENFYNTYCIISEILNIVFDKKLININQKELQRLKSALSIIIKSNSSTRNRTSELELYPKSNIDKTKDLLIELEKVGFITNFNDYEYFKLTDTAHYFKIGLEKEIKNEGELINKIEFFHIILCLREKKE